MLGAHFKLLSRNAEYVFYKCHQGFRVGDEIRPQICLDWIMLPLSRFGGIITSLHQASIGFHQILILNLIKSGLNPQQL